MTRPYQICSHCIMDTSDPEIEFDDQGVCNHCKRAMNLLETRMSVYKMGKYQLDQIRASIQESGRNKPYDCVLGVSGGVDSTYAVYITKKIGLRPLAVHFDNGWNSELAVNNIERALKNMNIELNTHVVDWEEFRDLQLSFLRASVPDAEIPTDHGIWALLYQTAARLGLKYIITGTNLNTESILPRSWTYYVTDLTYIKDIHSKYGSIPLRSFPHCSISKFMSYVLLRRIKTISILNCLDYDKNEAIQELERELGWRSYGGKHHESIYTRFFQAYILPRKFNIDKRRAHLSSLIVSNQLSREEALAEMENPITDSKMINDDLEYVIKKFNIDEEEFAQIMALPIKSYRDYRNESRRYERIKALMRLAQRYGFLPRQVGL